MPASPTCPSVRSTPRGTRCGSGLRRGGGPMEAASLVCSQLCAVRSRKGLWPCPFREGRPKTGYRGVTNPEESHPSLRFHPVTDARCQQPSLHDPNSYASPRSPVPATVLSTQPSGLPLRGGRDLLPGACQDCSALLGLTANSPAGPQVLPEPGPPRQGSPHFTAPMLPLCSVSTAGLTPH